jgi:transketolase
MRRTFADCLHEKMKTDDRIWLISIDLGYKMWDQVRQDFPRRSINTGAAEQAALGIAVGLAQEGRIPFVYSAASFLLYRGFETIRTYINYEQVPVKLVGAGRDRDYKDDGYSHWSEDAEYFLKGFDAIKTYWPKDKEEIPIIVDTMVNSPFPEFVSLRR